MAVDMVSKYAIWSLEKTLLIVHFCPAGTVKLLKTSDCSSSVVPPMLMGTLFSLVAASFKSKSPLYQSVVARVVDGLIPTQVMATSGNPLRSNRRPKCANSISVPLWEPR